jgi:hypothetical protein
MIGEDNLARVTFLPSELREVIASVEPNVFEFDSEKMPLSLYTSSKDLQSDSISQTSKK